MNNLKLVEEGLVNIYEHQEKKDKITDARELHEFLEVKARYNDWISRKLDKYEFEEGIDFYSVLSKSNGGRPSTEYYLKMDTAKELAMVENNEKGRQVRKYFIEVEKKINQQNEITPMTNLQMLQSMINQMVEQEQRVIEMENKVIHLETEFNKDTVEEGYKSNDNIAHSLNLYSLSNKAHSNFIDAIAKNLKIYNTVIGYKDEYVNVVRSILNGGTSSASVYYSEKAIQMMTNFVTEQFKPRITYYKRGENKDKFKEASFELNGKSYMFNEKTYKKYST